MADDKDGEKKVVKLPDAKGQKKPPTIRELLERPAIAEKMRQIVPRGTADAERLLRIFMLAANKTPLLLEANALTLLGAMMSCASLGLEPNTQLGHAFLIPFKNRNKGTVDVQLIVGYKGFIKLMWQSGQLSGMHADIVCEGDAFSYSHGSRMHLDHVPQGAREGRDPTHAYCFVRLKQGEEFEVMPYADVLRIRNRSEGFKSGRSPWLTDEHEMAKKTAIRRLAKYIPISLDVSRAASLDLRAESQKVNFQAIAEDPEMIGFEGDDDAAGDMAGGDDTDHGQADKVAAAADDRAAKAEASGASAKAPRDNAKPQGRRSFFGDDA